MRNQLLTLFSNFVQTFCGNVMSVNYLHSLVIHSLDAGGGSCEQRTPKSENEQRVRLASYAEEGGVKAKSLL